MKISKGKKVFLIVSIAVLLSIVFITPRIIRSVRYLKKVAYIADLLTGERAEEDVEVDVQTAIALGNLGDKRALGPLKKKMEEYKDEAYIMKDLNEAYRKLTQNQI